MGCVWRSYPRFEFLEKTGLLKLDENSYDKVKLSIKNPDYKDIAIGKFVNAYLYDLSIHGLKIDFDRYLLLHLLAYKHLVEPFSSPKHHVDFNKLSDKLHTILLQDRMLKVAEERFRAFFDEFKDDLQRLTPKQRLEVVANATRQIAILHGGNWDIVDKWISVEKSAGLHALKRLAGSPLFWNYFMLTISIREHYSTLLEKEEILLRAGKDNLISFDDWQLIKKWYDRAGTLSDTDYHLKNAQEAVEKFIFEFDWMPMVVADVSSEIIALRIAKGITSFVWNVAKIASLIHPAGRLARGAFLLAKWLSQSIFAFATWLGLEWLLDGLIQTVLRKPMEDFRDMLGIPNREFGLLPEEFEYVVNYFAKKELYDLSITDPKASELFARLTPKGQAIVLGYVQRARVKKLAKKALERLRLKTIGLRKRIKAPDITHAPHDCIKLDVPTNRDIEKFIDLKLKELELTLRAYTGSLNPIEITRTETADGFRFEMKQTYAIDQETGKPKTMSVLGGYTYSPPSDTYRGTKIVSHYFDYAIPAPQGLVPWWVPHIAWGFVLIQYEFAIQQNKCDRYERFLFWQSDCYDTLNRDFEEGSRCFTSYRETILRMREIDYGRMNSEYGDKAIASLVKVLLQLRPSYAIRLDKNLYRIYVISPDGLHRTSKRIHIVSGTFTRERGWGRGLQGFISVDSNSDYYLHEIQRGWGELIKESYVVAVMQDAIHVSYSVNDLVRYKSETDGHTIPILNYNEEFPEQRIHPDSQVPDLDDLDSLASRIEFEIPPCVKIESVSREDYPTPPSEEPSEEDGFSLT